MSERVSYTIEGHLFIIRLNDPKRLNSLTFPDFVKIAYYLTLSNKNDDVYLTLIQSTGEFFSSGGKFESVIDNTPRRQDTIEDIMDVLGAVASPNVYVSNAFAMHDKPIICCLNGPAVGLSACLVMLSDIVYAKNDSVYLLFPFANLGFVAEVGSSVTLAEKIGINKANEVLYFAKKLEFNAMIDKIINKNYNLSDTVEFNKKICQDVNEKLKQINANSLRSMKKLINHDLKLKLVAAQSMETTTTLPFWLSEEPYNRFKQMQQKQRRHKL
ncbi:hypothetical protein KAFR_0G02430 [Kazachstania africana CBS 2517]|uniref:Uncharacterized protein n=1 Tax=Kazachstania africana (strain ATCC 22294 / BCRC 22015 / CBS 2517 / CECT 1963 / NBRC 1671 / NRRL Y-8276) TaxID=1071382 RepID=H2AY27_KAZAF|nr:hypothetical protein KAFR_0G02430 [Kazachstania africana CBS 2517]CCF59277.1 hypothetical protein KAFR_0G02430 [Kazachstania africana CBS 2517]